MRLALAGLVVAALIAPEAARALSRKEQPPECDAGTAWHEETDLARYTMTGEDGDAEVPGRVGWCEKPDGTRHGVMRIWWTNGWLKAESTFVDGIENGPVQTFYVDGKPQLATTHKDGKPDGRYTHWHANGQRARLMWYDEGRPHGFAQYWDEHGQLVSQGTYNEGKKVGTWESWYPNGVLKETQRFEDGRLHGRDLLFNEGGVFSIGVCYDHGEKSWESRNEAEAHTRKCFPY